MLFRSYGCFPLAIYFTFGSVYMSMTLSHPVTSYPSPSPYPQVHSLVGLCLYSHLTTRFFMTFFFFSLDSIHMCYHTVFAFLFLTFFTLYGREIPSQNCEFLTVTSVQLPTSLNWLHQNHVVNFYRKLTEILAGIVLDI